MCKSVYWANINNNIENHVKNCSTCLEFQQMQPKKKIIHHDILLRTWEVLGADIFQQNNKNYLYVVDYQSKLLVIENGGVISRESDHNSKNHAYENFSFCLTYCIFDFSLKQN